MLFLLCYNVNVMQNIYLDNAATTQPLDMLEDTYRQYAGAGWYNPSALYKPAVDAGRQLKDAAETLLSAFGSSTHRCLFTSGGTEGANTVILRGVKNKKNCNYVCGGFEHPCVDECFRQLAQAGADVRFITPDASGMIDPAAVLQAVDMDTVLVSVMHVNNETGAINDIQRIAAGVKAKNPDTLFFSDGVQAFLREPLADTSQIDYYTVSAHKLHAHKGTGAIFYTPKAPLKPLLLGGGQQGGLRSGTEDMLGILSFAKAAAHYHTNAQRFNAQIRELHEAFLAALGQIDGMHVLSPQGAQGCAHIVTLAFEDVAGETLLHSLEAKGIYVSNGAACSSKKGKSRMQDALRLPAAITDGVIRVSFSIYNTLDDVATAAGEIAGIVPTLRQYTRK